MPDLQDRKEREEKLAKIIAILLFQMQTDWMVGSVNWRDYRQRLTTALQPALMDTYRTAGFQVIGPDGSKHEVNLSAEAWSTRRAVELADEIVRRTKERVKDKPPGADVEDVFGPQTAETTAATETTRAITTGERGTKGGENEKRTDGKVEVAVWYTERDARVCPICRPMHGRTEDNWPEPLQDGPPAHPRCRCWVTWEDRK